MDIVNLFKLSYWLSQPYPALGWIKWFWVLLFLGLILAGVIVFMIKNKTKDKFVKLVFKRGGNLFLTVGFFGLLWMFFRQEKVYFLGWRLWLPIFFILFVVWGYKILKFYTKRVPEIQKEKEKMSEIKKYLPKRKK